jgi:hypothetical protein
MDDTGFYVDDHPTGNGWLVVRDGANRIISEHKDARSAVAKARRLNRAVGGIHEDKTD